MDTFSIMIMDIQRVKQYHQYSKTTLLCSPGWLGTNYVAQAGNLSCGVTGDSEVTGVKNHTWAKILVLRVKNLFAWNNLISTQFSSMTEFPPHVDGWGLSQLAKAIDIELTEKLLFTNSPTFMLLYSSQRAHAGECQGFSVILVSDFRISSLFLMLSFLQEN